MLAVAVLGWLAFGLHSKEGKGPDGKVGRMFYRGVSWLGGGKKVKLVIGIFPSGQVMSEWHYDKDGKMTALFTYYENGRIKRIAPFADYTDVGDTYYDDGVQVEFYENGQIKLEGGLKPGGGTSIDNGIDREYSEDGNITKESFSINGKECTSEEWTAWVKTHPEDAKYGSSTFTMKIQ